MPGAGWKAVCLGVLGAGIRRTHFTLQQTVSLTQEGQETCPRLQTERGVEAIQVPPHATSSTLSQADLANRKI